jgi:hypothetical protein
MVEGLRIQNLHPTSATLSWELLVGTGQMGKNITLQGALVLAPPKKVWIQAKRCVPSENGNQRPTQVESNTMLLAQLPYGSGLPGSSITK